MRGAFITFEGTEGVGKSTLSERAVEQLRGEGLDVLVTREPGGTTLGEQIRRWILDGDHESLSAEVEALLMFAARGYHLDTVIRPALTSGRWVLCDRFTDATYAYQGGGRGMDHAVLDTLKRAVQGTLTPDLTILLDAPIEVGLGRIAGREQDHFEREDRAFFERVRSCYLDLAAREPQRFAVIDATLRIEQVWERVSDALSVFVDRFASDDVVGSDIG
ncbi:MAG: dTMP kinase [Gammaproteobacteria bacterium]|nr:dTMP kinase [Gammaproteobacteria bacterium]